MSQIGDFIVRSEWMKKEPDFVVWLMKIAQKHKMTRKIKNFGNILNALQKLRKLCGLFEV